MRQTVYDFDLVKNRLVADEVGPLVQVRDYFEYYTTGLEEIVQENQDDFFMTQRYQNERTDVIAYNFYEDENYSDVILAVNNDTYLWDAPVDFDTQSIVVDERIRIVEHLNHQKLQQGQRSFYERQFNEDLDEEQEIQKNIVLPKFGSMSKINRLIKKYLNNRKVF